MAGRTKGLAIKEAKQKHSGQRSYSQSRHPCSLVPAGNTRPQSLQGKPLASDSNGTHGVKPCPSGHFGGPKSGGTGPCCSPSTDCVASATCSGSASVSCVLVPESLSASVG